MRCFLQNFPVGKKSQGGKTSLHASHGQGVLRIHEKKFLTADKHWLIEHSVVKRLVEGDGAEQLKRSWMRMLPDERLAKSADACLAESRVMLSSVLFSWVGESAQNELRAAEKLLEALVRKEPPTLAGAVSQWM